MILKALLAFATLGLAVEYPVVSLFIPNADPQSLLGEVLAEQSSTTTYSINCPVGGTNSTECGMGPGMYLTTAPTSIEYLITDGSDNIYDHVICDNTGTPTGTYTCTDTVTGKGAALPGTTTSTIAQDEITLLPVTITSTANAADVAATANATATTTSSANGTVLLTGTQTSPAGATSTNKGGVAGRSAPTSLLLACVAVQTLVRFLL
ncbi:unnamed protein product [Penicillium glandicola]